MRILILNWKHPDDPESGGAERYVVRVAAHWAAAGRQVSLLVPRSQGEGRGRSSVPAGVRLVVLGTRRTVFRLARRYLREQGDQFDAVLESISTRPFFAHELVGDKAMVLYHQIADDVWSQEFRFPISWVGRRLIEPYWLRRIDGSRIVANSPSTARDLADHGVSSIGIVPPGADLVPERAPRPVGRSPRLVFAGRLVRTKRPQDAIDAFGVIRAEFPQATLDIIGGGYLEDLLGRRRAPGVTVHGFVSEEIKAELMSRADLLLLPGTREGWGIVVIEAGLHSLPTVAYDVPGFRDAVVDGETGILTEPNPLALGRAAIDLLRDPSRWAQQSAAARQRSVGYSWQRSAEALGAMMNREPKTSCGAA